MTTSVAPLRKRLRRAVLSTFESLPPEYLEQSDAFLAQLRGRLVPRVRSERVPHEAEAPILGRVLVASANGLLLWQDDHCRRLIGGFFYGLARAGAHWYAFRRVTERSGQILRFRLVDGAVEDLECVVKGLSPEIHQMDVWSGHLHATDTATNRILSYRIGPGGGLRRSATKEPVGPARGVEHPNYVHLNSLYRSDGRVFLVFHNQSRKTGRSSEVAILSDELRLIERRSIDARCAHNFAIVRGRWIFCDSMGGRVGIGDKFVELGTFTRGLVVRGNRAVVGGSNFGERTRRRDGSGFLYELDLDSVTVTGRVTLGGSGSIYELRGLDQGDLGQSEGAG
ncbi:MAG: hypothetical protein HYV07_31035 [Deltaproteobacteria bacterium]|nr:hypothetical protein [Deltaproteobacteria bacterium]